MISNISCPDIRHEAGPPKPPPPSAGMEIERYLLKKQKKNVNIN